MVNRLYIPAFFAYALLLSSCQESVVSEDALKVYISKPENGLIKNKEGDGSAIQVTYRPVDMLVMQEKKSNPSLSLVGLDSVRKSYDKFLYFIIKISMNHHDIFGVSSSSLQKFSEQLSEISFHLKDKVHLITSANDTIPVADYVYPRMYNTTDGTSLLFSFSRENLKDVVYMDFVLENSAIVIDAGEFRFRLKDINKVPKLF